VREICNSLSHEPMRWTAEGLCALQEALEDFLGVFDAPARFPFQIAFNLTQRPHPPEEGD
jgi:hypothetical protein